MAWAVLCGGLYGGFFGPLERRGGPGLPGLAKGTVAVIEGMLYTIALVSLFLVSRQRWRPDGGAGPVRWAAIRRIAREPT